MATERIEPQSLDEVLAFQPFRFQALKYLAIPRDHGSVQIIGEHGQNYGAWTSIESFKAHALEGLATQIGKVVLSFRCLG